MPYDDGQECPYYGGIRLKATTNTHAAPRKNARLGAKIDGGIGNGKSATFAREVSF